MERNIIVAGSNSINQYGQLKFAIYYVMSIRDWTFKNIINGDALSGVDQLALQYSAENQIPIITYKANWSKYGQRAGYFRNTEMAKAADAAILLWDGVSRGTMSLELQIRSANKPVFTFSYNPLAQIKAGRQQHTFWSLHKVSYFHQGQITDVTPPAKYFEIKTLTKEIISI